MINRKFAEQVGWPQYVLRNLIRQFYKRVLRRDITVRLPTGRRYLAPLWDPSASEVFVTNASMDWGAEALFYATFPAGGVFVDVGAHTGYYSVYMAPKLAGVIAIEPNDRCIPILKENLSGLGDVQIFQAFAADQSGAVTFNSNDQGFSSGQFDGAQSSGPTMRVITVDEVVGDRQVDGIKIDVDGPDLLVVQGARATIARCAPILLVECPVTAELLTLASGIDCEVFAFSRMGRRYMFEHFTNETSRWTKMAFLVPRSRQAEFRARVQTQEG